MDRLSADEPGAVGLWHGLVDRLMEWLPLGALRWDLITIVAVAAAVQTVFPDRADWAAHTLAGGALVVIADAVLGRRLGGWAAIVGGIVVLLIGVAAELTATGPFDPGDVAFTLAGAVVVTGRDGAPSVAGDPDDERQRVALAWGVGLLAVAVYYRYGIRRGP